MGRRLCPALPGSQPLVRTPRWPPRATCSLLILPSQVVSASRGSGSAVKNPSTKQETQARSLTQEDPLEEEMAAHSSVLAWEIPWTEEPGGLQSELQRVVHD